MLTPIFQNTEHIVKNPEHTDPSVEDAMSSRIPFCITIPEI